MKMMMLLMVFLYTSLGRAEPVSPVTWLSLFVQLVSAGCGVSVSNFQSLSLIVISQVCWPISRIPHQLWTKRPRAMCKADKEMRGGRRTTTNVNKSGYHATTTAAMRVLFGKHGWSLPDHTASEIGGGVRDPSDCSAR